MPKALSRYLLGAPRDGGLVIVEDLSWDPHPIAGAHDLLGGYYIARATLDAETWKAVLASPVTVKLYLPQPGP